MFNRDTCLAAAAVNKTPTRLGVGVPVEMAGIDAIVPGFRLGADYLLKWLCHFPGVL
jgi:hypothetical protein